MVQFIRRGHHGPQVKQVQNILRKLGFDPGPIDGDFGPLTQRAVQIFQKDRKIMVDGIVGPQTWALLFSKHPDKAGTLLSRDAIFISYRREDTADVAGRIYDRLCARYSRPAVFRDIDSIPIGVNFRNYLDEKLRDCRVVLVVIGRHWLSLGSESRLHDPTDFLRIEIECALQRGISIVPVLVQGASMPRPADLPSELTNLAYYMATNVRPDPDFHRDMDLLIDGLNRILSELPRQ